MAEGQNPGYRFAHPGYACWGTDVNKPAHDIHLTDEQRLDWLRLIRSQNVGPRGIMAQTPQGVGDGLPVAALGIRCRVYR
jgi:hypothetical protein